MQEAARQIIPLGEDQLEVAAGVFVRAFQDDPLFAYGWPDAGERARWLLPIARWNLAHGRLFGVNLTTSGELDGFVTAYPSGGEVFTADRMAQSGYHDLREAVDAPSWDRLLRVFDAADRALHHAAPEPHWYLETIAVDPARQGAGAGTALVRAVHDRADADGAPTVLLTFRLENVAWYGRRGYEVACSGIEPTSRLPWWGCSREPRCSSDEAFAGAIIGGG
jgi:ribosomal protein S18 acetylase RimI-like enzyme